MIESTLIEHKSVISTINGVLAATLMAVDPIKATRSIISRDENSLRVNDRCISLSSGRLFILGIGKASLPMAQGLAPKLQDIRFTGLLVTKKIDESLFKELSEHFQIVVGDHPIPGNGSLLAGAKTISFLNQIGTNDHLILLISGGASALVASPVNGVDGTSMQETTRLLLESGAPIRDVNCIRKHLDGLKGGGIARMVHGAETTSLVLSDVMGNALDVIASGPAVPDETTFQDAMYILAKYQLLQETPDSVLKWLKWGVEGKIPETPKPGDRIFDKCQTFIIGSNRLALDAAAKFLSEIAIRPIIVLDRLKGEAFLCGRQLAALGDAIDSASHEPWCLLTGGETTVTIHGRGWGGRNLEMALGGVAQLARQPQNYFLTFATDGEDGPTDAAGAVVTARTLQTGMELGLSPDLVHRENDSYHYFERAGGLIKTGSTGTNVNDLAFLFHFPI